MGTVTRPELSTKSKYWINKHRYYELKHFCLQYPIWKAAYLSLDGLSHRPDDLMLFSKSKQHSDPTARCVEAREYYAKRMELVEQAAMGADSEIYKYILSAVTEGLSYETLYARHKIPCCKNTYYILYRKFFWLLNQTRG